MKTPAEISRVILRACCVDCADDRDVYEAIMSAIAAERAQADAQLSELRQAIGPTTTASPSMVMDAHNPIGMAHQIVADVAALREEVEQLRVQLAGCLMAAEGATGEVVRAKRGDYGWSLAYQTMLDFRAQADARVASEREAHRLDIVFDGPPGPESGRFVEVERDGKSISVGEWLQREDGFWVLRLGAAAIHARGDK